MKSGHKLAQVSVYGAIVAIGAVAVQLLPTPLGLPAGAFYFVCAPLGALAGYEIGSWFGRSRTKGAGKRRIITIVVGLLFTVLARYVYDLVIDIADPGPVANLWLYLLYGAIFFGTYVVAGTIGLAFLSKYRSPNE